MKAYVVESADKKTMVHLYRVHRFVRNERIVEELLEPDEALKALAKQIEELING